MEGDLKQMKNMEDDQKKWKTTSKKNESRIQFVLPTLGEALFSQINKNKKHFGVLFEFSQKGFP
jgi:hypothetical protein